MVMPEGYFATGKRKNQQLFLNQLKQYGSPDIIVCNPAFKDGIKMCVDPFLEKSEKLYTCEYNNDRRKSLKRYFKVERYREKVEVCKKNHSDLFVNAAQIANSQEVKNKFLFIDYDTELTIPKLFDQLLLNNVFTSCANLLAIRTTSAVRGISKEECYKYYNKIIDLAKLHEWNIYPNNILCTWNDYGTMFGTQTVFSRPI
jgi:hypothetical protein